MVLNYLYKGRTKCYKGFKALFQTKELPNLLMGFEVITNNGKYWSPSISTTNLIPHITLGFNKDLLPDVNYHV